MLIRHTHTNSIFQYFLIFFFHFIYLRNKNRSSKKVENNRIHFCKFVIFSCALSTVTGARAKKVKENQVNLIQQIYQSEQQKNGKERAVADH